MSLVPDLSPQERLALSRKAIVKHMSRHDPEAQERQESKSETGSGTAKTLKYGKLTQVKYLMRMWWNRHPASAVVDLASPVLSSYAKAHSFKLLGISVLVGFILAIIRPWRMISISALLVAAVKSSGLSNALLTMLSSLAHSPESTDTTS